MDGIEGENTHSATDGTWTVTYPYGVVSGIAACNNTSGTQGIAYPQYNNSFVQGTKDGIQCWCRMTSPVRSAWAFTGTYSSTEHCGIACVRGCASDSLNSLTFRTAIFNSAGN